MTTALTARRQRLPKATDRLPLGNSGLLVSPFCIGMTADPNVIPAAFDAGINFFFLTGDLHWPLYEGLRLGLQQLFSRRPSVRDEVVVGVVSYLDEPLFRYLQFHEVIGSVPGLDRVDLLIAGAVPHPESFNARFAALQNARAVGHAGARAIGASFHHRPTALASLNLNCMDMHYIRYNTGHPGARYEIFPHLRPDRTSLIFNFKSMFSYVSSERFNELGLHGVEWLPHYTEYYRFVLSHPSIDGVLCSPGSIQDLTELLAAVEQPPLTLEQEEFMMWLSAIATPRVF